MASLLIPVIYLTFISLGLPDSLLGTAWPVMHLDLGAPVAAQSAISIIISCCTIASSLMTARLVRKLGTGRLCALSVGLTAVAILSFAFTGSFWQLCLISIPYGLGAGAIDAALNNYVALNYGAKHMSWLHCCWGVGASIGPVVMGWALTGSLSWHGGYLTIGAAQALITIVLFFSLPLWKRGVDEDGGKEGDEDGTLNATGPSSDTQKRPLTNRELLGLPGAIASIGSFGFYCALEGACGLWSATYLVTARGIDTATAASMVSLFYMGITVGRLISGFAAQWMSSEWQIRSGQALIACGITVLILTNAVPALWASLGIIGLGCAPIYPSIVALTPGRFGERASQGLVSLQMACAYAGYMIMPPIFGIVAGSSHPELIPAMVAVLLILDMVFAESAVRRCARSTR